MKISQSWRSIILSGADTKLYTLLCNILHLERNLQLLPLPGWDNRSTPALLCQQLQKACLVNDASDAVCHRSTRM